MRNLVTFQESDAREVLSRIRQRDNRADIVPQVTRQQFLQLGKVSSTISAAGATGQLVSGTVQLYTFDSTASSPVTTTATDLATVTAWNPFTEDIPTDTYVVLGRFVGGWIIIQVLNYCP